METSLWFKMFLFLLVIGVFMSLVNAGSLPVAPTMPATGGVIEIVGTTLTFAGTLMAFFTGIGALLGIGGAAILPSPFSWLLAVVIVIMWVFLIFEIIRTITKSVLP